MTALLVQSEVLVPALPLLPEPVLLSEPVVLLPPGTVFGLTEPRNCCPLPVQMFPTFVQPLARKFRTLGTVAKVALVLWAILFIVIAVRVARTPTKNTVLTTYLKSGEAWLKGETIYSGKRGFVYSPLTAAVFAPISTLPPIVSNSAWRLLTAGIYLGAIWAWLKSGLAPRITPKQTQWLFILLLPLSIGNFNNAQVNPLLIGLVLLSILAAHRERWFLSAFLIGIATYIKIYPLAFGLLLATVFPKKLSWRLVVALVALGGLSFVLQKPAYVLEQYQTWIQTRSGDNRLAYNADIAPNDLSLLFRLVGLEVNATVYRVIQLATALALAVLCAVGGLRKWPAERLLGGILALGCSWALLCGPATESATYILLAPAVTFALLDAFSRPLPTWMRATVVLSFVTLVIALGMNSFLTLKRSPLSMCPQPIGALLFCIYSTVLTLNPRFWVKPDADADTQTTLPEKATA